MLQPRQKSRRVKSAKVGSSDSEAETTDDENIDMHPIVKEITNQGWFPKKYKKSRFRNVAGIVAAFRDVMDKVTHPVHLQMCGYVTRIAK